MYRTEALRHHKTYGTLHARRKSAVNGEGLRPAVHAFLYCTRSASVAIEFHNFVTAILELMSGSSNSHAVIGKSAKPASKASTCGSRCSPTML